MTPRRIPLTSLLLLMVAGLHAGPAFGNPDHPNMRPGLSIPTTYLGGGFDTINAFNGNLVLRLPLGGAYPVGPSLAFQLTMFYNLPWNRTASGEQPFTNDVTGWIGNPGLCPGCDTHNAGAGWRLSLGQMWPPMSPPINTQLDRYLLVEGDGTRRYFYPTLHPGENFACESSQGGVCEVGYYYTRDGSYLRARIVRDAVPPIDDLLEAKVEWPDGSFRHFNSLGQVDRLEDPHGNSIEIAHHSQVGSVAPHWVITDSQGRSHTMWFHLTGAYNEQHVDYIDLAAFGGNRLILRFHYEQRTVPRPNSNPVTSVPIPVLVRVALDSPVAGGANAGEYQFDYYGTDTAPEHSGAIKEAKLPTLGRLEWDYGFYVLGYGTGASSLFNVVRGVDEKRVEDAAGNLLGEWHYDQLTPFDPPSRIEARTRVTNPAGDQSIHYFTIDDNDTLDDWRHGLPFSPVAAPVTGPGGLSLYLSSETWEGAATGNPVRRSYVRFTSDLPEAGIEPTVGNRRLLHDRTYFVDDGSKYRQTARSDFDGLGHFDKTVIRGNFAGAESQLLENLVGFNPATGNYEFDREVGGTPTGGFQVPATGSTWFVDTFNLHAATGTGYPTVYADFCFEAATGFLRSRRARSAGGLSANDLVEVYEESPTAPGFVGSTRQYGGDTGAAAPTGSPCELPTADPTYELASTYQDGVLATSAWKDASGGDVLEVVDQQIDPNTGLVSSSTDVSGSLTTQFEYDRLSRLVAEKPAEGAWTTYTHTKATGPSSPAKMHSFTRAQGLTSGSTLQESEMRFDSLGRVDREEGQLPSGVFQRRDVLRNAMGWVLLSSEWSSVTNPLGDNSQVTSFDDFDAFGRPRAIYPPDTANHRVNLAYSGVRQVMRKVRIATDGGDASCVSEDDENCVDVTETYDELGRLRSVVEPSGAGGANVTTSYLVDGFGRLRKATTSNASITQNREFEYDGRGLLVREKHPEKGVGGNSWTRYCYDAGGNVVRRFEGDALCSDTTAQAFDLRFDYDRAQRLLATEDAEGNDLQTFSYWVVNEGTSNQHSKGKLERATRFNHLDLGGGTEITVPVVERYRYNGTAGRVSERLTQVGGVGEQKWWLEGYVYNFLGDVTDLDYPCLATNQWQCTETTPTILHTYSKGYLAGITGWLPTISYHDNGMLAQVVYDRFGAGADPVYEQGRDANRMQRPASLAISTAGPPPPSFHLPLRYDGAGNVKGWVSDEYRYDGVSRLLSFELGSGEEQHYAYDAFGNLESINRKDYDSGLQGCDPFTTGCMTDVPVAPATNRLTGSAYDAAGNLLSAPAGNAFSYDLLGSLTSAGGEHYVYTADGERIGILDLAGDETVWRLRDLGGQVLREYRYEDSGGCVDTRTLPPPATLSGTVPPIEACLVITAGAVTVQTGANVSFEAGNSINLRPGFRVQAGASLVARIAPQGNPAQLEETRNHVYALGYRLASESSDPSIGRAYIVPNWLGSPRRVFDADDPTVVLNNVLFGYGERLPGGITGTNAHLATQYLFTGHERDVLAEGIGATPWADDLDHMHARGYWGLYGRFLSFDPVGGNTRAPQTWNRYAYVMNNPIKYVDPFGLFGTVGVLNSFAGQHLGFLCSLHSTCLGLIETDPSIPFGASVDPFGFDHRDLSLFGAYGEAFDVAFARGFLQNQSVESGPIGTLFSGIGLDILNLHGINEQRDLGIELAVSAVGGPLGKGLSVAVKTAATVFKTAHYGSRLAAAGIDVARAESLVAREIAAMRPYMGTGADVAGRIRVDGVLIEYRARLLTGGAVNVGTIFAVRP